MTWDDMEVLHAKTLFALCGGVWEELSKEEQANAVKLSRAALLALHAAGVRFMPEVATEEMVSLGWYTLTPDEGATVHSEGLFAAYRAMLAAGEIKPGDGK